MYRPLTMLSRLYTCLATIITSRLDKVMGLLILPDQTGFLPGRQMHENIVKIQDMLHYTKDLGIPACLIGCDLYHAYDCVDREVLLDIFDTVCGRAPGPARKGITRWIELMMADSERSVIINGTRTAAFTLQSGLAQGCPCSPISFALFIEPLGRFLRDELTGITLPNGKVTYCVRYADDVNLFLRPEEVALSMDILRVWAAVTAPF